MKNVHQPVSLSPLKSQTTLLRFIALLVPILCLPLASVHAASGDLDFIEKVGPTGAKNVAISQDGTHVYVIYNDKNNNGKVVAYHRNVSNGKLELKQTVQNQPYIRFNGTKRKTFFNLSDIIVSSNGEFVYVSSITDQNVFTFRTHVDGDELKFLGQIHVKAPGFGGGHNVTGLAISDDGKDLYVVGSGRLSRLSVDLSNYG